PLPREAPAVQKLPFSRRRLAAQYAVSMRKSSEFRDDIAVRHRKSQLLRITERLVQPQAAILIGQQLGMHERQIKERPHGCVGFLVEAPSESAVCYGAGQVVGCKRACTVAEHVPRELVE